MFGKNAGNFQYSLRPCQRWGDYKMTKIVAIWQHNKRVLGLFSLRVRRNAYLRASGRQSDLAMRLNDADFLYQVNNSSVGIHFRYVLAISSVRMRRNSVNFASGLNTALIIVFSDHDFL